MRSTFYEEYPDTILSKAIIKVDLILDTGRSYPPGTVFKFRARAPGLDACWYDFTTPSRDSGFVKVRNSLFRKLSKDGEAIMKLRRQEIQEHIEATRDKLIYP
jgi:hypothetical protein